METSKLCPLQVEFNMNCMDNVNAQRKGRVKLLKRLQRFGQVASPHALEPGPTPAVMSTIAALLGTVKSS